MKIYDIVKKKLSEFPRFRERRFRGMYLSILALRKEGLEEKYQRDKLSYDDLADFARSYDSFRHEWDTVMRENPNLQGLDYPDKDEVEQEVLVNVFDYQPGFYRDINK